MGNKNESAGIIYSVERKEMKGLRGLLSYEAQIESGIITKHQMQQVPQRANIMSLSQRLHGGRLRRCGGGDRNGDEEVQQVQQGAKGFRL